MQIHTQLDWSNEHTYRRNPGLIRRRFLKGIRGNHWRVAVPNRSQDTTHTTCLGEAEPYSVTGHRCLGSKFGHSGVSTTL